MNTADTSYMLVALKQAAKAYQIGEVPVGAIVVDSNGAIIGRGYNKVMRKKTQRAHAEMLALEAAARKIGDWRLDECVLYITLEPCSMCMAMIRLSRVKAVVFGANSPLFGYRLDNKTASSVYTKDIEIRPGVLEQESSSLLKQFFKNLRKKKDEHEKEKF